MIPSRRLAIVLWTCMFAGVAAGAWAQATTEPGGEAGTETEAERPPRTERKAPSELDLFREQPSIVQAGPVDPERYVLGPGDVLELALWGRLSRSITLAVSPEGTIFLPGSGPLEVTGRTLAWSRQRILRSVVESFRGVRADVRLVKLRTFKVYLFGQVRAPGALVATSVARASEVVSVGGLADGGSRRNIEIRRRDGSRLRLDLDLLAVTGRQELDPTLVDGDVILVPKATEYVTVSGAVASPFRYEFARDDSLSTLLQLGGGLLPSAAPDQALMIRFVTPSQRESVWVDLRPGTGESGTNFPLRDGDRLFVQYRSDYHVLPAVGVYGEIQRPGEYPIVLGQDRLSDLIRWAGGFRPLANRSAIHLLRETVAEGERDPEFDRLVRLSRSDMTESEYAKFQTKLAERKNSFRVDWARIQKESADIDPLLQGNDVVRVDQLVPTVRIEGEVKRPGFVDYAPGRSLNEYIALSGGFTDHAARNSIRVSRSFSGQVIPARSLAVIQPGDFVWVPERKDVDAWAVFRDAVAVAGQVAVLVFTLSR